MDDGDRMESGPNLHAPDPDERQLTARAVLSGCLLGGLVTSMNLYLGLKTGWIVGGSLMAAILGFGLFATLRPAREYTILEANITQTTASGAGTMAGAAGLVSAIPAMKLLDHEISTWALFAWALAVGFLGVMFSVPLRRQYLVVDKLRFPTGTATAHTIVAMFARAEEAVAKARVLLYVAVLAFAYVVAAHFYGQLESPPLASWFESAALATAAAWGFSLYVGPMVYGAGFLIGPRTGASLAAGAVVGWALLGPLAKGSGWAPHEFPLMLHDPETDTWGVAGWILWPGVAIMVGDALMSLALSWRKIVSAVRDTRVVAREGAASQAAEEIPGAWWIRGLGAAALVTVALAWIVFEIPPHLSLVAVVLSAVLANVAVRSMGETDINPAGQMGQVTQAAFGALSSSMPTNLMAASITAAGAGQAADMMQDLKTGQLLGASPRKQFRAQLFGIAAGVAFAVPVYLLFDSAWDIGGEGSKLAAPVAQMWTAVAQVMSHGLSSLPDHASEAMLIGLLFGAALAVARKALPQAASCIPSGMAFGIAFIIPAFYSLAFFLGAVVLVIWGQINKRQSQRLAFAVACGLIAGEGLAGVVNALLTVLGVG